MRISDDLEEMRLLPIHVEAAVFGSGNVPIANINENYRSLLAALREMTWRAKHLRRRAAQRSPGYICISSFRRSIPTEASRRKAGISSIQIFPTGGR